MRKWHGKELHEPVLAIVAIFITTGKVVRPPLVQLNLEPLAAALVWTGQHLGLAEVALDVAPQVGQQVDTVAAVVLAWRIILEHCSILTNTC